ncbi:hypothetical protein ACMC9I_05985 [Deinococcota bacterium DY0809b]
MLAMSGYLFMGWGQAEETQGASGRSASAVEAFLTPDGGKIALPEKEAILLYPKGAVDRPVRIRVEKVSPEDLPGPIQEGVVVIGAVHLTHPDLDYSQPYAGVYKHNPLQILFRWENYAEEPGPEGRYYTAVCQWDDYQGRGTFGVVRWGCTFADPRRVVEYEGGRYFLTSAPVVPPDNGGGWATTFWCSFPRSCRDAAARRWGASSRNGPGVHSART